jgi:hypothetical protein
MDDIRVALMCTDLLCKRTYVGARGSSLSEPWQHTDHVAALSQESAKPARELLCSVRSRNASLSRTVAFWCVLALIVAFRAPLAFINCSEPTLVLRPTGLCTHRTPGNVEVIPILYANRLVAPGAIGFESRE